MTARIAALAACSLALAACNRDANAPAPLPEVSTPAIAEKEPNDTTKTAQQLDGDAIVKGRFGDNDDWYQLLANTPSLLKLELDGVEGLTPSLVVLDADANPVMKATAGAPGESVLLPSIKCTRACLVQVVSGKKDAVGEYKLAISLRGIGERAETEPNGKFVDAQPIAIGAGIDGYIATPEDEDWFKVDTTQVTGEQVLSVIVKSPPNVRLELSAVRTSDQAILGAWKAPEAGVDLKLRDLGLPIAPETGWLLLLKSAWVQPDPKEKGRRMSNAKTPYSIDVRATPGAPGLLAEPNDGPARASPVTFTKPENGPAAAQVSGFIAPKGDADWYLVKVDAPSILGAEVSGLERVNLVLSVIDPAKKDEEKDNELVKIDRGDVREGEIAAGVALQPGDNFVKIEGAFKKLDDKWVRDYENFDAPYTLTLTLDPDDGTHEREPNDTAERSMQVEKGKEYRGFIQPAGDVDTFRIEVAEPVNVTLNLSAVPKLDLTITVRDPSRTDEKGKFQIIGTVDRAKVEGEERLVIPFEPGSYLIEIADKAKQANPQKRYVLSVK